jgi:DNA-binding response OmpR family regulator
MHMGVRGGVAQSGGASSLGAVQAEARLLVVEDDPNIRELLSASLRFAGFAVDAVTTGVEAVTAARESSPDLVVLDVMLPDLDGFEVIRRLRETGQRLPVVFLTARDGTEDKIRGLTLGGDDYVTKPFSLEELTARIRAVLRRTAGDPGPNRLAFAARGRAYRCRRPSSSCCDTSCSTPAVCCRRRRSSTTCGTTTSAATTASSSRTSRTFGARSTSPIRG